VSDPLTIVLIDQNPDTRAMLLRHLQGSAFTFVGNAGYGVEVAEMVAQTRPDFMLLGLEEPVSRGLQTLETLAEAAPQVPIIVYSSLTEGTFVRKVMLASARDYLGLPLTAEQLAASTQAILAQQTTRLRRRSGEPAGRTSGGTVLTIFGVKGGIGKTTIATNLATALHRQTEASVVLVDMDTRFGDVAVMLGISTSMTLSDAARDARRLDRTTIRNYLINHPAGVSILPAPEVPADWEDIDPAQLVMIVRVLAETFDYVILDTPGTFNEVVGVSLELATVVLLVTSLELASIKDADMVLAMLRGWSFPAEKLKLVLNHTTTANGIQVTDVARALGVEPFWQIPFDQTALRAGQLGQSVVLVSPRSRVSQNLAELAGRFGGVPQVAHQPRSPLASVAQFFHR
jgi:pilus assembly protein CpaE